MQALLNTAIKAARKAGDIAQINFDRINESDIKTKGHNEFVTYVDQQAEKAIKEVIQSRYPDHGIIAEESKVISASSDLTKELKELHELYKEGVLTKEEFEKAKKKLLN